MFYPGDLKIYSEAQGRENLNPLELIVGLQPTMNQWEMELLSLGSDRIEVRILIDFQRSLPPPRDP